MAKFAPIVPPNVLDILAAHDLLGDYHLLLVHEVLEHPNTYNKHFGSSRARGHTVILDNSAVELGKPMTMADLIEAAKLVDPTHVVVPDVIGDPYETIDLLKRHASMWKGAFLKAYPMVVLQCEYSLLTLVDQFIRDVQEIIDGEFVMGIPRSLVKVFGTRADVIRHIAVVQKIPMHMLGFSDNLLDDISCARTLPVMGIDSSLPALLGTHFRTISLDDTTPRPFRDAKWEGKYNVLVGANIALVRAWLEVKT